MSEFTQDEFFGSFKNVNMYKEYILKAFINDLLVVHIWYKYFGYFFSTETKIYLPENSKKKTVFKTTEKKNVSIYAIFTS